MQTKPKIILIIIVIVAILIGLYFLGRDPISVATDPLPPNTEQPVSETTPTNITKKDIEETNFTGTRPIITGSSILVLEANKFIDQRLKDFAQTANKDVPEMRKEFGADAPTANYSIDINAKYLKGNTTESIVIDWYEYTGGANGNSLYKVFTTTIGGTSIILLKDAIKADKQAAFMAILKQKLIAWRSEGSTESVVFPDLVNSLKFSDLSNWSLDDTNLTIYFAKYEISPGSVGPIAFPLPMSVVKDYLATNLLPNSKVSANNSSNAPDTITYTRATKDLITVELPLPGDVTGKNFRVIGKARGGWFFEASFPIELRDKNGKLLTTGIAQAQGDWMTSNFVPFKADIVVPNTYIGEATLILKKDNASGLPENDASISFPITVEY